jgi:hypothetical protein
MKTSSVSHGREEEAVLTSRATMPWPPAEGRADGPTSARASEADPLDMGPSSVATLVPSGNSSRPAANDLEDFREEPKTFERHLESLARLREEAGVAEAVDTSRRGGRPA